jgi:flagella basal body P-ring formation protein FlgA
MKTVVSLIIALFVAAAASVDADAAILRQSVTVQGDVIRIGDLFVDAGKDSDAVVAEAPAPGQQMTLNARALESIAQRAGLQWRPQSRYESTTVSRAGRIVRAQEIEKILRDAMVKEGMPKDRLIALSKADFAVHVAPDEERAIRVVNARYNLAGRQFAALLEVPRGKSGAERLQVTGNLYEMVEIPVLAQRVQRGDRIREQDVETIEIRRDAVAQDAILDRSQVIGKTPRRLLQAGKPLRGNDLQTPLLVEKGKLVTIVLRNRQLLITAQGRALEDGAKGEVIRVSNTRSRTTIQGLVVGLNRVSVSSPTLRH